jgi:SAM domain (Sterile alpha motif)
MDLGDWLRGVGLESYEPAFRENEINEKVLPSLTAEDLKDLGVVIVGHRRVLLDAIETLVHARFGKARCNVARAIRHCGDTSVGPPTMTGDITTLADDDRRS